MNKFTPTIGIEVHAELNTKHKAFSTTPVAFGKKPNTLINEIDLGMPGTLPTLNLEMIDFGIKTAIALNCKINQTMYFDRKNYFYADNPKNFQITQAATPIGYDGYLDVEVDGEIKRVEIERMHLEEDTAKSIHEGDKTYLDFNRAGVPLIEIVTKPVIHNSKVAMKYLEKLRETLLYLGVSDVKMEEGSMRCDANVSISDSSDLGTKAEVKNIGSIKSVGLAIDYEIDRQQQLIHEGQRIIDETRRYDETNKRTISMRTKETGNDYRYFPEPDIPIVHISDEWINKIHQTMPILPDQIRTELRLKGINDNNIEALIRDEEMLNYYNAIKDDVSDHVITVNILISDLKAYQNKFGKPITDLLSGKDLVNIVDLLKSEKVSKQQIKQLLVAMIEEKLEYKVALDKITRETLELEPIILKIINDNPEAVNDYKEGKDRAIKHLMGQIMKETKGAADAKAAKEQLILILDQQ